MHFATHGLLAGETEALALSKAEPALLLTPPQQATTEDDGLLTASEVAQLKLDADWVVLSACNTAQRRQAGRGGTIRPRASLFLCGCASATCVALGVNSDATVKLVTKAFDELKANPGLGRSEALRRSMLALCLDLINNLHQMAHGSRNTI